MHLINSVACLSSAISHRRHLLAAARETTVVKETRQGTSALKAFFDRLATLPRIEAFSALLSTSHLSLISNHAAGSALARLSFMHLRVTKPSPEDPRAYHR